MTPHFLTTPWQRSLGAMFKGKLGDTALVFVYPQAATRLFHTAFCSPLRILALDDGGAVIFNQVVLPWRMVRLPATRFIIELDSDAEADEQALREWVKASQAERQVEVGSWHPEATLDRLFYALLNEAVADIRRVNEANQRAKTLCADLLIKWFKPWERGQILGSAAWVLEGADHVDVPENVVRLSRRVIEIENQVEYMEELLAASLAGVPWDFPKVCFKCESTAHWRPVLAKPRGMPEEIAWRYDRPENHVPICRRCVYVVKWNLRAVRRELAHMLWGARFEALEAWHRGWLTHRWQPAWDLEQFPLWPKSCGGDTWETGSGSLDHAAPQEPEGVYRKEEHWALLKKYFQRKPPTRRFWTSPLPDLVGLAPSYSDQEFPYEPTRISGRGSAQRPHL